ncbi:hypothetical protein AB9F29_16665 [Falsihalocynthiibacter sp. S25ZX9]|uniref:hypothetical protein n=1 Tax=Falsihalocynthiibacter sp. S25ZX9 TaxID=3240870 RepID=UPI00350EC758
MAGLTEDGLWAAAIYQIEKTDPVVGGPPDLAAGEGITNQPHLELANRTSWLKTKIDALLVTIGLGHTSGLDADMVDGLHGSQLARTDVAETFNAAVTLDNNLTVKGILYIGKNGGGNSVSYFYDDTADVNRAFYWNNSAEYLAMENADGSFGKVWNSANDGTGSGMDADLLDGVHAAQFARTDVSEAFDEAVLFKKTATVQGELFVGKNSGGSSIVYFYDDTFDLWRNLWWDDASQGFRMHNSDGSNGKIWNGANDGTGSGLDADLLDGVHLASIGRTDISPTFSETVYADKNVVVDGFVYVGQSGASNTGMYFYDDVSDIYRLLLWSSGLQEFRIANGDGSYGKVWNSSNDGTGSGMDADLLDGVQLSEIAHTGKGHGAVGQYVFAVRLSGAINAGSNYAGSSLRPSGMNVPYQLALDTVANGTDSQLFRGGSALSGTWKALGEVSHNSGSTYTRATLFMRIS